MSVPIVTAASVAAAAADLKAKNQEVTYRAIGALLGGGSHRDIGRHLRAVWDEEVTQIATTVAAKDAPSEVEKCVRETASKIEGIVSRRAATELRGFRDELDAKNALVVSQRNSALQNLADLQDELDRVNESSAVRQRELDQQHQQVQSLQREVTEARTETAAAKASQAATQARIADFKELQDGLLRDLDAQKELSNRLREREREVAAELRDACAQAAQAEVAAVRALAQVETTNQHLTQRVDLLDLTVVAAKQELYESHMALLEMTEKAAKVEGELKAVKQQHEELLVALDRRPVAAGKLTMASEIKTGGAS